MNWRVQAFTRHTIGLSYRGRHLQARGRTQNTKGRLIGLVVGGGGRACRLICTSTCASTSLFAVKVLYSDGVLSGL